uniref:Uncharacterized protein n=1 Tax=Chromera velia CCMP2878 TaxID=1169474 RepID=A0A0G4GBK5_9ALVE|eukprot:Cvel_21118.t1-p1 / transcript=Cvel_21118.t1 / gene=Cvel_21118 / organism=Chromera_velia_CCMP2878 / gene_product=hypothetical protein / transcript_product=hypothetical protein / location=Cvel_scaffold1954:17459-19630(+) / protein_length=307 / sequence_SO=supercontig / SO=protein_coding / is_pseudo=false
MTIGKEASKDQSPRPDTSHRRRHRYRLRRRGSDLPRQESRTGISQSNFKSINQHIGTGALVSLQKGHDNKTEKDKPTKLDPAYVALLLDENSQAEGNPRPSVVSSRLEMEELEKKLEKIKQAQKEKDSSSDPSITMNDIQLELDAIPVPTTEYTDVNKGISLAFSKMQDHFANTDDITALNRLISYDKNKKDALVRLAYPYTNEFSFDLLKKLCFAAIVDQQAASVLKKKRALHLTALTAVPDLLTRLRGFRSALAEIGHFMAGSADEVSEVTDPKQKLEGFTDKLIELEMLLKTHEKDGKGPKDFD